MNYTTKQNNIFESYTNTNLIRSFSNNEWDLKWTGTQIEIASKMNNNVVGREWVNIFHDEKTNTFEFIGFLKPCNVSPCVMELCEEIANDVLSYYQSK